MAEVAALNLAVNSDSVKQASVELKTLGQSASAAERAAQRWGMTTDAAARSTEDFSKRVQGTIKSLEFERQQLTRTAAEQAKYAALRRAGVAEASAEGRAIAASVAALQAQKSALTATGGVAKAASSATAGLVTQLRGLVAAYVSVQAAQELWTTAMAAGDLGEQAEQIGVNTDQLQAYRLAAAQAGISAEQMDTALTKLAKTMGTANEGNKDAIANFDKLGVKILDASGQMRPVSDVLPEVAAGVLKVGSSSERTALLMELFGRSGAKMATVLGELARGNDDLIASARQENAIISPAAIAAWDTLGDKLTTTKQIWSTLVAELGARYALPLLDDLNKFLATTKQEIEALIGVWDRLVGKMQAAKAAAPVVAAEGDVRGIQERLDALRQNPTQFGFKASEKALMDQLAARQAALSAQQSIAQYAQQFAQQGAGTPSSSVSAFLPQTPLGATGGGTSGARNPTPTASGSKGLSEAEKAAKKLSEWMRDANASAEAFLANQEVQRQSLFLSAEAASALKIETDFLNKAKADDVTLTEQQRVALHDHATAMAASEEKTRNLTEAFEFAKDVTSGFFSDFAQGLRDGQSLFESFGNAAVNVLNKIADKLISMAVSDLVGKAFGGTGGSTSGFLSGILSLFSGGGGMANAGQPGSPYYGPVVPSAYGNAFHGGNVIPFARGGIVSRPTLFPMANGAGLMGEAGPEAVMPLRRGSNGKLGVEASGGGGGTIVNVYNNADGTKATARESKGPGGQVKIDVIVEQVETRIAGRMSRGQGALTKTMEGQYGLQRQGR